MKRELMMADIPANGEKGESLGVLDIERRSHELLVQSFHLFDETQLVIKTQAIIEVAKGRRIVCGMTLDHAGVFCKAPRASAENSAIVFSTCTLAARARSIELRPAAYCQGHFHFHKCAR